MARPVALLTRLLVEHDQETEVEDTDTIKQLLFECPFLARNAACDYAVTRVVPRVRCRVVGTWQHELEQRSIGEQRHPSRYINGFLAVLLLQVTR